jgi:hypothetical protein
MSTFVYMPGAILLDWQCHWCLSCTVEEDSCAILQGGSNGF